MKPGLTLHEGHPAGRGPRLTKVGDKTLISVEAACDWVERMERESPVVDLTPRGSAKKAPTLAERAGTAMITIRQRALPETRTRENSCAWLAEATINGCQFEAKSRRGAPHELARALVAAGIPDQPVQVENAGRRGAMHYRSLHSMAGGTFTEGIHTLLSRAPYREFSLTADCPALRIGEGQNGANSQADVSLAVPEPRATVCAGCGAAFTPSRRWATFCSAACKQKAYRARRCGPGSGTAPSVEMRNTQQPAGA
jgi:hypothetical protein